MTDDSASLPASRPAPRPGTDEAAFWDHLAAGRLCLQRCTGCGAWRYPPGPACPGCGGADARWTELSGRGHVIAWTVFHRSYFPSLPAPYTIVSVETEEGPLLIGNLVEADGPPAIGDPVTAILVPARFDDGRTGAISQWRPALPPSSTPQGETS